MTNPVDDSYFEPIPETATPAFLILAGEVLSRYPEATTDERHGMMLRVSFWLGTLWMMNLMEDSEAAIEFVADQIDSEWERFNGGGS